MIEIQRALLDCMRDHAGKYQTAEDWARSIGRDNQAQTVFKTLEHLAANQRAGVTAQAGEVPVEARYGMGSE